METKKNYEKPTILIEEFVANQYVATCDPKWIYKPGTGSPISVLNSDDIYRDGWVGKNKGDLHYDASYANGKLDLEECIPVGSNSSNQRAYDDKIIGWVKKYLPSDIQTAIGQRTTTKFPYSGTEGKAEIGVMQDNGNQFDCYTPGTLVVNRS